MRFKLFGFKGNLDTLDGATTTKQPKEDKGAPTIICTGYRTFSDFDRPVEPSPPQQINHVNQASTSHSTTNGALPKGKTGKLKIQQDTSNKEKTKATKPDKTKEQKQQKDVSKVQKTEEKIKAQQLKEHQGLEKKKKQKESAGKGKKKQLVYSVSVEPDKSTSTAAFTQKPKASSSSKSKSKTSKAPGTPPMPTAAAVNPIILAKQQQRKEKEKDKTKHKSITADDVELRHKDKSSSRQKLKPKEEILLNDKAKSLPNLTNPQLIDVSNTETILAVSGKTTTPNDVNKKHKSTPSKLEKAPAHKDLPEDGSISIVSGKTTTTTSIDENAKKHKSITPRAGLILSPNYPQKSKPSNSDSDDYDDYQNDGSINIVSGKTNKEQNSTPVTIPPPIAPQRSKKTRENLPDDGSIFIVSGKTTNTKLPDALTPLPAPLQRSKISEEISQSKAKSLPNLANPDLDDSDDYQNDLPNDGSFMIVSGKTTSAPSNDEDNKKSTLIFMTEGDEDDETTEYAYPTNYTTNTSFNPSEPKNPKQGIKSDYSSHATNIFFSNVEPEPAPRNRKFLVRNDDDNASQTSA